MRVAARPAKSNLRPGISLHRSTRLMLRSIIQYFLPPDPPLSSQVRVTTTRIECVDCKTRTLMTVVGTCSHCNQRNFVLTARLPVAF
jgi:hypothetical protein